MNPMPKPYFDLDKLDGLYPTEDEESADHSNSTELLSGTAQQLKSPQQAAVYKNFQGPQVEETTLVQDQHTQIIQADQWDEHTADVNTNLVETAPTIHKSVSLNQAQNSSHSNLNENVNTTTETHSINVENWETYSSTKQVDIPQNLSQNVGKFGGLASEALQSDVGTQNFSGQSHSTRFKQMNINAPVQISGGPVNLNSQQIKIGGGGSSSSAQKKSRFQNTINQKMIRSIVGSFSSNTIKLAPVYNDNYFINIEVALSGDYKLENMHSMNPLSMSTDPTQIKMGVSQKIGDYFLGLEVEGSLDVDEAMAGGYTPTLTIGNTNGKYTVSGGVAVPVIYKGTHIFQYSNSLAVVRYGEDYWKLSLTGTMVTTVFIRQRTPEDDAEITANNLFEEAMAYYQQHKNTVAGHVLAAIRANGASVVDQMYNEAGFIDSIVIDDMTYARFMLLG